MLTPNRPLDPDPDGTIWRIKAHDFLYTIIEKWKNIDPYLARRRQRCFERYQNFCQEENIDVFPIFPEVALRYFQARIQRGNFNPEKIHDEMYDLNWSSIQIQVSTRFFHPRVAGDKEIQNLLQSVLPIPQQTWDPNDGIKPPYDLEEIKERERRRLNPHLNFPKAPFYPLTVDTKLHPIRFLKDFANAVDFALYEEELVGFELYICGEDLQSEATSLLSQVFRQQSKASVHCYGSIMKRYGKFCKERTFQMYPITPLKVVLFFQSEAVRPIRKRHRFSDGTSGPISTSEKTKISPTTLKNYSHYLNFCRKSTNQLFQGKIENKILDAEIPDHPLFRSLLESVARQDKESQKPSSSSRTEPYRHHASPPPRVSSPNDDGAYFSSKRNLPIILSARDMVPTSHFPLSPSPSPSISPPEFPGHSLLSPPRKGSIASLLNPEIPQPSSMQRSKAKPGSIASLLN